ncbi:MAG: nucleotidyl transferase AbiEii/AbiGii toxin family protein [Planctomycetota bacterium]|nr:nucleotidyl transferase AbiEii/AbiGii toxin family protein [Planctomycetota bacterium]
MAVSLEFLDRCASETGYEAATLEKVTRLGEIASEINRHRVLKDALALKGGTAINLRFGAPPRMSVDLDYNYIGQLDRASMLRERPGIEEAIIQLVTHLGYRVQLSADAAAGRKIYATYRSALGPDDRIEVDVNFMWRVPLGEIRATELWQPGELDRPRVIVVSDEELWVGKFLAMLDRAAPRDAWDIARMPSIADEVRRSSSFRRWFLAMSVILDHPVDTYSRARFERQLPQKMIETQLHPMLTQAERPTSEELTDGAWAIIRPFLQLSDGEAEYVRSSYAGDHRPELLFPADRSLAERLSSHPQIRWKLKNVREYVERNRRQGA